VDHQPVSKQHEDETAFEHQVQLLSLLPYHVRQILKNLGVEERYNSFPDAERLMVA